MAKNKDYEVVYICDGKGCADAGEYECFYGKRHGACMHTSDPTHAKNGASDPKKHPERFDKFSCEGCPDRYYERMSWQ